MATSVQEQSPAVSGHCNEENKAALKELIKKASSIVDPQDKISTTAIFENVTGTKLELMELQEWSGHWKSGGPAQVIEAGKLTEFVHIGGPPDGSMAGVRYAAHELGHQWVVAWHVQLPSDKPVVMANTVYFEDGPEGPVDWNAIKAKLGPHVIVKPVEPSPPPAGCAEITQGSNACLAAIFTKPN